MEVVERITPVVITRVEAIAAGLKTYFTGKPCPKGHVAERQVSDRNCVECNRAKANAWAAANAERVREYRAANADRKRATDAARYAANPERRRATNAAWYAENAERRREYRAANAERIRATDAAWHSANADRKRAAVAAWYAANPEKVNAIRATRRARKRDAIPADIDQAAERKKIAKLYAAAKRLEALTGFAWQVDHRVPLARGGLHVSSNLQLIPALLNLRKNDKLMYVEPFSWVADAQAEPALALPWLTAPTAAAA